MKKYNKTIKTIQDLLKKNGVKMSAIEVRELMRISRLSTDEQQIKTYVNQLRKGVS
jgi:hypothetical protein